MMLNLVMFMLQLMLQYHDYAKLNPNGLVVIDNKVFESAITFWFKDVDFDGDKVWEYFHMNN